MYILYYKELYIVPEQLTKNRTCQSWRSKQIAMCEEEEPLIEYMNKQKDPDKYFIEKQPQTHESNEEEAQ